MYSSLTLWWKDFFHPYSLSKFHVVCLYNCPWAVQNILELSFEKINKKTEAEDHQSLGFVKTCWLSSTSVSCSPTKSLVKSVVQSLVTPSGLSRAKPCIIARCGAHTNLLSFRDHVLTRVSQQVRELTRGNEPLAPWSVLFLCFFNTYLMTSSHDSDVCVRTSWCKGWLVTDFSQGRYFSLP